jgi:diacylglycerol kinase family enzyme
VPAADVEGGNHFAADVGLDRDDVASALDAFVQGSERRIDLAGVHVAS